MKQNKCHECGDVTSKVIYCGLPMALCNNRDCNWVDGFWAFVPLTYFNGVFMSYHGSYLAALWRFALGDWCRADGH